MRSRSVLTSTVNFYISILFIASFGLMTTSSLLRYADLDDPITDTLSDMIVAAED